MAWPGTQHQPPGAGSSPAGTTAPYQLEPWRHHQPGCYCAADPQPGRPAGAVLELRLHRQQHPAVAPIAHEASHISPIQLSASTTPGLCQLTALRHLDAAGTRFSVQLLAHMTDLQELKLQHAQVEGPGSLSVLTGLTDLKHLALPESERLQAVLVSQADSAAITASSQLTYLDINTSLDSSDECLNAFQGSKQLPHLVELRISLLGLCDERTAALVAKCCPNLQRLWLGSEDVFDDADQAAAIMEVDWYLEDALR